MMANTEMNKEELEKKYPNLLKIANNLEEAITNYGIKSSLYFKSVIDSFSDGSYENYVYIDEEEEKESLEIQRKQLDDWSDREVSLNRYQYNYMERLLDKYKERYKMIDDELEMEDLIVPYFEGELVLRKYYKHSEKNGLFIKYAVKKIKEYTDDVYDKKINFYFKKLKNGKYTIIEK